MIRRLLLATCLWAIAAAGPVTTAPAASSAAQPSARAAGAALAVPTTKCSRRATLTARRAGRTCSCRVVRTAHGGKRRCRTRAAGHTGATPSKTATPATPAATPPNAPAAIGPCANADVVPAPGNVEAVRTAIVCLVNQERAKAGVGAVSVAGPLSDAADAFSLRMVLERFFAHVAPDGADLLDRVVATGYVGRGGAFRIAENIGYGTGTLATPAAMVQAWMDSPGHRANILEAAYRDTGVGVALGVPTASGGSAGATFTQDFGVR